VSTLVAELAAALRPGEVPFTLENCGVPWGMYTNFYVADVQRFEAEDAQRFLQHVDDSGEIYLRRWGDLSILSALVQLLLPRENVHHFTGWGYLHNSGAPTQLNWGVLQMGRDATLPEQLTSLHSHLKHELNWTYSAHTRVRVRAGVADAREIELPRDTIDVAGMATLTKPDLHCQHERANSLVPLTMPVPREYMC
jgi:hypothetical protein